MAKPVTLLLCQPPTGLARDEVLALVERTLAIDLGGGPRVAVYPELMLSGYTASVADPGAAYDHDRQALDEVRRLCKRNCAWTVLGAVTKVAERFMNTALCINDQGEIVAVHHKRRLFGEAEACAFGMGDAITLFDTPLGRTGMAVCFDIEDPALVAEYRRLGAETILTPTANMRPYTLVSTVKVRSRALDNELLIAYANYAGRDGEWDFPGDSVVVNGEGEVLAQLGPCSGVAALLMPAKAS